MISIEGRKVVLSESVILGKNENQVLFEGEHGLKVQVQFMNDGTAKPSFSPIFSDMRFKFNLNNFGSALGTAVSGEMTLATTPHHTRPGTWRLKYSLTVHTVGEDYRVIALTISEGDSR